MAFATVRSIEKGNQGAGDYRCDDPGERCGLGRQGYFTAIFEEAGRHVDSAREITGVEKMAPHRWSHKSIS